MKVRQDPETGSLCMLLKDVPVGEPDGVNPGLIPDCDAGGTPVAVGILNASRVFGRRPVSVEAEPHRR